jgi:predicted kinase
MRPPWSVLVLFGASGTGKSTAAAWIGRQYGLTWLQVDDLRLTLQYSRARLPERTDQLYFFDETPDV